MTDHNCSFTVSELYAMTKKIFEKKIHDYVHEWCIEILESINLAKFHTKLNIYNGDMNHEGPRLYLCTAVQNIRNLYPGIKLENKHDNGVYFYQASWDIDAVKEYESSPKMTKKSYGTRSEEDILRAKACLMEQYHDVSPPS